MQNKRYDSVERQVLPVAVGVNNLTIQNQENTTVNYHGIRFKGRVMIDLVDAAFEFGSGWISLLCLPPGVAIPLINNSATMENNQQFVIATEPFSVAGGGVNTIGIGAMGIYDFDIVPRTSRNCMKDAQIVGQVVNESVGITVLLTALLSSFETTN